MAITFFGSATSPADLGTNAAAPVTVTPPASMVAGDLVVVVAAKGTTALSFSVSTDGGQIWYQFGNQNNGTISSSMFWCRFNGTWGANPQFTRSGSNTTSAFSAVMNVFRPTTGSNLWGIDVGENYATYTVVGTTKTITGVTTAHASTVTFAAWVCTNTISWGSLSGTGWTRVTGNFRNSSSSALSLSFAYNIKTSAGATNNVSQTQSGAQAGGDHIVTFYETAGPVVIPRLSASNGNLAQNGTVTATGLKTAGASQIVIDVTCGYSQTSTITSLTVNGNAATQQKRQLMPDGTSWVETWTYWSSAALTGGGSGVNVAVTLSTPGIGAGVIMIVSEGLGTDANSIGNSAGANGTSTSPSVSDTCSATGSIIHGAMQSHNGALTVGSNTTFLVSVTDGASDFSSAANNNQATTSGNSYSVAATMASGAWGAVAVEIKPSGSSVTAAPTGIASAEAFGSPSIKETVYPTGIASAQAFGSPSVRVTAAPAGIASAEAFGSPSVRQTVAAAAIASAESFGAPAIRETVTAVAIASSEAFGSPSIRQTVTPAGVASAEALGAPAVLETVYAAGIASAEAFGSPTASPAGGATTTAEPVGIPSGEAFGSPSVNQIVHPAGIASSEAMGGPSAASSVHPGGIASAESFGVPSVTVHVTAAGIPSAESFGSPHAYTPAFPDAIPSGEAFGTPAVRQIVYADAIPSSEAFGSPSVTRTAEPVGISSAEALGSPRITVIVYAEGAPSSEAFGTPRITEIVYVEGIASEEAFGTPLHGRAVLVVATIAPIEPVATIEAAPRLAVALDALAPVATVGPVPGASATFAPLALSATIETEDL